MDSSGLVPAAASAIRLSYRILNPGGGLAASHDPAQRGKHLVLGEAYAFGVMWSFTMNGLAVLALRYHAGDAEFRVALNLRFGGAELPLGLALITLTPFFGLINLFRSKSPRFPGSRSPIVFFAVFQRCRESHAEARRLTRIWTSFICSFEEESAPKAWAAWRKHPGSVSNYHALYHLDEVPGSVTGTADIAFCMSGCCSGRRREHELEPDSCSAATNNSCSAASWRSPKTRRVGSSIRGHGKRLWDGILRAAQNLQSARIVLGSSTKFPLRTGAPDWLA